VDALLKEVYEKDSAVLMGISAGAICWFQCGCTDSELAEVKPGATYGWANDMLNFQKYAFCPHYEDRVEDFAALLEEKTIDGLAFESDTAFVEEDGTIYYIKSREGAKAYLFAYQDGKYHKEKLCLKLV
jgi:dipeptidase E